MHRSATIIAGAILLGALGSAVYPAVLRARDAAARNAPVAAASVGPAERLSRLELSQPVVDVLYRYGQNVPAANGAYGINVSAPASSWFLEYQRAGGTDVVAGVLRHDTGLIGLGLRMFRFGLDREAPNGTFPGSAWPFHGTAMFLSEAGPALIILKSSPYAGQYAPDLKRDTVLMDRAARAMVRTVGGAGKIDESRKNHRFFEAAVALGATAYLASDGQMRRWSQQYAWTGIRMQRPDGVMPENGGHDSGYQALGMVSATRYLELTGSGSLHRALYSALQRGEAWELSRIAADGSVNEAGDTRTAQCQERDPSGRCKTVMYAPIFSALAHWAAISGDVRFTRASHQVWLRSGYGGH